MSFQREQRIRSLDRSVLAGVARQHQPGVALAHQPDQVTHLASANLSRLVHQHNRASREFTSGQKTGDRFRRRKFRPLQVHDLLPLRREDDHVPPTVTDLFDQF